MDVRLLCFFVESVAAPVTRRSLVCVCDRDNSTTSRLKLDLGCGTTKRKKTDISYFFKLNFVDMNYVYEIDVLEL